MWSTIRPDLMVFRHAALVLTSLGVFFLEWGLFIPFSYLASYTLDHGSSPRFSYMLLSLLNAGGLFGRWISGYFADKIGRFNMLIVTVLGSFFAVLGIWLPASSNQAALVVFALVFGFFSGGNLCTLAAYGRYYSTAYTLVSLR
ncbi:hypothetical protein ACCO45_012288 [Purpureocillium lilacinum]|uniref:Uncharacterized protein n=1 Tax=Purpureocillium lilacinum TaxID=33203 RepID=A0ACC4DEV6_PURLI